MHEQLRQAQMRLREAAELPTVLQGRGMGLEDCIELELGLDDSGNLLIPIRDIRDELIGLKGRYLKPGKHKYFEVPTENKNPPWLAPDLLEATQGFLFVEGELNAMVTWLATREKGFGMVGLGSAFAEVPNWVQKHRLPLFLYLDHDTASNKSAKVWLEQTARLGLKTKRLGPLLGNMDACEYAEMCGLDGLGSRLEQLIHSAK